MYEETGDSEEKRMRSIAHTGVSVLPKFRILS